MVIRATPCAARRGSRERRRPSTLSVVWLCESGANRERPAVGRATDWEGPALRILVSNVGSSSYKFSLLDMATEKTVASGRIERIGDLPALQANIESVDNLFANFEESLMDDLLAV